MKCRNLFKYLGLQFFVLLPLSFSYVYGADGLQKQSLENSLPERYAKLNDRNITGQEKFKLARKARNDLIAALENQNLLQDPLTKGNALKILELAKANEVPAELYRSIKGLDLISREDKFKATLGGMHIGEFKFKALGGESGKDYAYDLIKASYEFDPKRRNPYAGDGGYEEKYQGEFLIRAIDKKIHVLFDKGKHSNFVKLMKLFQSSLDGENRDQWFAIDPEDQRIQSIIYHATYEIALLNFIDAFEDLYPKSDAIKKPSDL
jgi:hypothetical protein